MSAATKPPPIRLKRKAAKVKAAELAPTPPPAVEAPAPEAPPAARDPSLPPRITLRRVKGWRMPVGTVVVTRGGTGRGLWGNPFRIEDHPETPETPYRVAWSGMGAGARRPLPPGWRPIKCRDRMQAQVEAVAAFEAWITQPEQADVLRGVRTHLRGRALACFCSQPSPCHADVLLKVANAESEATP